MDYNFERDDDDALAIWLPHNELFTRYPKSYKKNQEQDVEISFEDTEDEETPLESQIAALDYFVENANELLENLFKYIDQEKEVLIDIYGGYNESKHLGHNGQLIVDKYGFPDVKKVEDIYQYFGIGKIYIKSDDKNNVAYIGITGGCTWDEEHGFGAIVHKSAVVELGDWNTGYSFSKHNINEAESFARQYGLESLAERKKRIQNRSKIIEVANEEEYLKLFDWLIDLQLIYGYRLSEVDLTTKEKIALLLEIKSLDFNSKIRIWELPSSFSLLTNLKYLGLSNTKLSRIPTIVFSLTQLESLSIPNNVIKEIPAEIKNLTNLKRLDIRNNQLHDFPVHICDLLQLESLTLSGNNLTVISDSISNLKKLQFLAIDTNQLHEIPDLKSKISGLRTFYFHDNPANTIKTQDQKSPEKPKDSTVEKEQPKIEEKPVNTTPDKPIQQKGFWKRLFGN